MTTRPPKDYQQERYLMSYQLDGTLCKLITRKVVSRTRSDQMESEKFLNFNSFVIWKMNFMSGVFSSPSFPTEATVWVNDIDSAREMNELMSSSSMLGRMTPDFE